MMKTNSLFRIATLPLLALIVFACQKTDLAPSLTSNAKGGQVTSQGGPEANWTVQITEVKNDCNEQEFFIASFNQNGGATEGQIEFKIDGQTVATGTGSITVTTHLDLGVHALYASVSTGVNFRGESTPQSANVQPCGDCPYKGLDDLTCADFTEAMKIGEKTYSPSELCELLGFNRGNSGNGALVKLAQAVMVAKWNGFTSDNATVAAAEALIGSLNALNSDDQASVNDRYGATEKGHVQDLYKCNE